MNPCRMREDGGQPVVAGGLGAYLARSEMGLVRLWVGLQRYGERSRQACQAGMLASRQGYRYG